MEGLVQHTNRHRDRYFKEGKWTFPKTILDDMIREEKLSRTLLKDGWGKPFDFSVTAGELAIRSTSQAEGVPTEPVKIRITGSAGKSEKEDK